MNTENKTPEVLSPCGSMESLTAALRSGADAVYIGGKLFSARHNAQNFTKDEIIEAVRLCHKYGALIYQAINTVVTDAELVSLAEECRFACEAGIDGLIVQDRAVEAVVRRCCPDMPLHVSTQSTLHTENGLLWAKEHGYSRAVLSRELPKDVIERLCRLGIETEVFVHGALCMSVSGQCYLSALIGSRSANRGLCAGACRLPFSSNAKAKDKYALSLKDLSLYSHCGELADCGVSSLKIEGRMKRPEYVAAATSSLCSALNGGEYDEELLKAVFSRSGFTDGYFSGERTNMFGARTKDAAAMLSEALPKIRELYRKEPAKFPVSMDFTAVAGQRLRLRVESCGIAVEVYGDVPEAAINRPADSEYVAAQLQKLGGTLYYLSDIKITLDEGLSIPASKLNSLRRLAIEELDLKRTACLTVKKRFDSANIPKIKPSPRKNISPEIRIQVKSISQLELLDIESVSKVILPLKEADKYLALGYPAEKAIITLPRFTFNEEKVVAELERIKDSGFYACECQNPAHIRILNSLGIKAVGGFGLNITNSVAAGEYFKDGVSELTAAFELKATQINRLTTDAKIGAIVYGKLPLMLTVNCPIKNEVGCKGCTGELIDRTGAHFPVLCGKESGYFELLNSKTLWLADKLSDFNIDFAILKFTNEAPQEVKTVVDKYNEQANAVGEFTRGLYYRGID